LIGHNGKKWKQIKAKLLMNKEKIQSTELEKEFEKHTPMMAQYQKL
jgi:hypothetical protein